MLKFVSIFEFVDDQGDDNSRVDAPFQRRRIGIRLLLDAYHYARKLGRSLWEFAEEIDTLRRCGLTNGDLRWLVRNGLIEHGREVSELGNKHRKFCFDHGVHFQGKPVFC